VNVIQIDAHTPIGGRILLALVIAALAGLLALSGARAAEPVALVLETEGGVSVEAFSEILEGQTVNLEPNATMTFTIYAACEEVSVRSGRVTFMRTNFRINAGRVLSRERTECPEVGETGNDISGVVLRGPGVPAVCRRPNFVLTGPGAPDIDSYAISGPGFDGTPWAVGQRTLKLPDGWILQSGGAYQVSLFANSAVRSEIKLKGNGRACRQKDMTILRVK